VPEGPSKETFDQWADATLRAADKAEEMAAEATDAETRDEWRERAEGIRAVVRGLKERSATGPKEEWR
jgi:predicted dienelactone hydrolase